MAIGVGYTSYGVAHQSYGQIATAALDIHAQLNGLITQNDFLCMIITLPTTPYSAWMPARGK